jgi:excinuclease ABC subunit C
MDLTEKLSQLPASPGVYQMKDAKGLIIYVGKALSLRSRVRSYFADDHADAPRTRALVAKIADIQTLITDSETEALVLEQNLIKEHRPRYNVNLKDDKKYPFIKITNEPFPRVQVTRYKKRDGAKYFGPYTNTRDMRKTIATLNRVFPTRTCGKVLPAKKPERPCLNQHIGRCLGPCAGLVGEAEYTGMVLNVREYLSGRMTNVREVLEQRMAQLSGRQLYEQAAGVRDLLTEFESAAEKQKVFSQDEADRDIFAMARQDHSACGLVLQMRAGKLIGSRHFFIEKPEEHTDPEIIGSFLKQYYADTDYVPREIFLSMEPEDRTAILTWLESLRNGKITLFVPQKGEKHRLLELAARNAELLLTELLVQREKTKGRVPFAVEQLMKDLHLPKPPRRIEAIDISNISGQDAVGSLVVFKDGKPLKSDYRRFKIKTVTGPDDFAMVREVVERRYSRRKDDGAQLPDLVLIDGGKGQLSSAKEVLDQMELRDLPVIGLAKRLEEVFLPGLSDPQNIPKHSSSLKLLQAIRDEAHRFAVAYHHKLRELRTITSELDEIPGIGAKAKQALLRAFGSVAKIKETAAADMITQAGLGPKQAQAVWAWFKDTGE